MPTKQTEEGTGEESTLPPIILNSNSGEHAIEFLFEAATLASGQPDLIASICLAGRHWDGDHDQALSLRVEGVPLCKAALENLATKLSEWSSLPLSTMAATPLVGRHVLTADSGKTLTISFGDREDIVASGHPVVSIQLGVGRMRAAYHFASDPSCLRLFVKGLSALLKLDAE